MLRTIILTISALILSTTTSLAISDAPAPKFFTVHLNPTPDNSSLGHFQASFNRPTAYPQFPVNYLTHQRAEAACNEYRIPSVGVWAVGVYDKPTQSCRYVESQRKPCDYPFVPTFGICKVKVSIVYPTTAMDTFKKFINRVTSFGDLPEPSVN